MFVQDPIDVENDCEYFEITEFNESHPNQNGLLILHQNIRSTSRNYDEFSIFVNRMKKKQMLLSYLKLGIVILI